MQMSLRIKATPDLPLSSLSTNPNQIAQHLLTLRDCPMLTLKSLTLNLKKILCGHPRSHLNLMALLRFLDIPTDIRTHLLPQSIQITQLRKPIGITGHLRVTGPVE